MKKTMPKIIFKRDEPSMVNYFEENLTKLWRVWFDYEKHGIKRDTFIDVLACDFDEAIDEVYDVLGEDNDVEDFIITDYKIIEED